MNPNKNRIKFLSLISSVFFFFFFTGVAALRMFYVPKFSQRKIPFHSTLFYLLLSLFIFTCTHTHVNFVQGVKDACVMYSVMRNIYFEFSLKFIKSLLFLYDTYVYKLRWFELLINRATKI